MITTIIDPLSDERWMEFIASQEQASIHYHPAWLRVICGQNKLTPQAFCSINDCKIISGFLFIVAKGFTGNKLAVTVSCSDSNLILGNKSDTDELLRAFLEYMKQMDIKQAEFRDNLSSSLIHSLLVGYAHYLTINTSIEAICGSNKTTAVSRNIRRSEKEGLVSEICNDLDAIKAFYALHVKTRKKLGTPVQSLHFFVTYLEEIVRTGAGYIVSVKKDGIPLSIGLFAGYNNTLSYKFGASNPEFLSYRPNNLMLWAAILEAQKRRYKKFDMGRTDFENEGLRRFKLGWGCQETPLCYSYYPAEPQNQFLRNVNKLFVAPVIRNSPEFVCRAAGMLAYKLFPMRFI
jgi:hypothetical protein